jgi:U3 small nucleolar RNA-associated protein MPP10
MSSKFIDELLAPKKTGNKLNKLNKLTTKKTQESYMKLLTDIISEEMDSVDLTDLDATQVWALIESFSKNLEKDLKSVNESKQKVIMNELKGVKKQLGFLTNKRERSSRISNKENDEDGNLGDEIESDKDNKDATNSCDYDNEQDDPQNDFFDMKAFNEFADEGLDDDLDQKNKEDSLEEKDEEDHLDNLDPDKETQAKEFKYKDFFDPPKDTNHTKSNEIEYDDNYIEDDIFNIENKILKNKKKDIINEYEFINPDKETTIEELEDKMMGDKDWHMKGEVKGKERPKGSLVENFLDFETTIKAPPIPTAEYTESIETLIKSRIKEDLFDDPIRKTIREDKKSEFELDFQKDKKGLAEVYEEEYEKNVLKLSNDNEINEAKKEIDELCNKVYTIFDKLTNNNFISGARKAEMKVLTNVPSIQLEEISNYVTDNKSYTKSANELFSARDAELKTKDELSKEERETAHKNWKRNVRSKLRAKAVNTKLSALTKATGNKFEAKMMIKQDKDKKHKKNVKNSELKSSKFFSNLQNVANEDIEKKKRKDQGLLNQDNSNKNVKNYKL